MDLQSIQQLLASPLAEIESLLMQSFHTKAGLINELTAYTVHSGGKRLRPILSLLTSYSCGYHGPNAITLAAIIEYIHTATLLHDDVVDGSEQRRAKPTANCIWSNPASVLVGDFLYSRAFQMMVSVNDMRILDVMANTTNKIAEGEILQLMNRHNPHLGLHDYLEIIHAKTAKLFEAATMLGAILANQPQPLVAQWGRFGLHLGVAFQMIDDLLDYVAPEDVLGKNLGDDLAEGKMTLPLIFLLENGTPAQQQLVTKAISQGKTDALPPLIDAIKTSGALEYARQLADKEIQLAKAALPDLPDSPYFQALQALCQLTINRQY